MPNPNLTSAQVLPGFFGFVDYNTKGSGKEPTRRALLWGIVGAAAQATLNKPFLPGSQQEANDGCVRGSDLARYYAAAVSQPEAQGAEVWLLPLAEPSGGVASIYKLKVYVSNTNPSKAGTLQLWAASRPIAAVGFTTSDTATSIGAALAAAINATQDLPFGTATASSGEVSIPYVAKGAHGEDMPFRCNISPSGSGVKLSPGQAVFATAATGAGSVRVGFGALSVSTTLSGGEAASAIATAVAASFNSDSYPLTAAVDGNTNTQVNFFFVNDKDVRRMSAAVITSTGTTVDLGSGATSGAGSSSSLTYNGTLGTGVPTLTSALSNLDALDAFRSWAAPWMDTTTIGSLATKIEAACDGSITGQKLQHLTLCSPLAASVAGAVPPATSPNLTTAAPHYALLWSPDCAVQGMEIAARVAAARASKWLDAPQFNWNGFEVKGNESAPILLSAATPSPLAQNAALFTYALAPVVNGPSGNLEVVKGRTTSLASKRRLWAWSIEAQAAYHATDLALYYKSLFSGGSIVIYSDPKAPGIFDAESVKVATQNRMKEWERRGNFDGAEALKDSVKVSVDPNNPSRFNCEYPESGVIDLDQIVFTGNVSSPSP